MNMTVSSLGLIAILAGSSSVADTITEHKAWQQTFPVSASAPRLFVRNIWGNVTVRRGTAREIVVSADEKRSAPTQPSFDKSKEQLRLDVVADAEGVSLIVDDPQRAKGRADTCRGCRLEYQFEITVPAETLVDVGTITDGRVDVVDVAGLVNASNVNGPVRVTGLNECSNIESVNGALDVKFARSPGENCSLKTINGAITVGLPTGTGLDAALTVAHGDIESDFEVEPVALPMKIEKNARDDQWSYRVQQAAGLRLGAGGPTFTFASLNGDVRILKNK